MVLDKEDIAPKLKRKKKKVKETIAGEDSRWSGNYVKYNRSPRSLNEMC